MLLLEEIMKVLELNHVCFSYTEEPLIEDLNLKLRSDEGCVVLYGRNGAGKSTLLNLICGLFPYGGEIVRDDFHIAYLPYDNPLMEDETVLANLQFFSRVFRQKNFSAADADTAWIMDALSIDFLQQRLAACSSGQKQKAALACLLLSDADMIILDEPFHAVDYYSVHELIALIQRLKKHRLFLITTHQTDIIPQIADRLLLMEKGGLRADVSGQEEVVSLLEEIR